MKNSAKYFIGVLAGTFALLSALLSFAEEARFTASVSNNNVSVGEQIQVTFELQGGGGRNFQAPSFSGFSVLMGPNQSTSMSIVNGSVSQSISYTYVIQADKEGTVVIAPASIEVSGKRLTSNAITINVAKGSSQPQSRGGQQGGQGQGNDNVLAGGKSVFLKASIGKTNVYQGEAIAVTYKLYTKVTLVNYAISKIPSFNGFWSQDIQMPQQLEFHMENYDGVNYKVADVKKLILFPQRSGTLTIDPMEGEVIARVQVKRQQQRSNDPFDLFNDPFFNNPFFNNSVQDVKVSMKSEQVKINVRELPANAPDGFSGAVGKFTVESSLDKTEVKAHDGVTLKIKVSGKGNLKLIDPPKINFPAEFEAYDPKINSNISASTAGVTGSKTFEYLLIPRNAGEYKIPVGDFSYFDLDKNQYQKIAGQEFLLKVGKGEETSAPVVTGVSKSDVQFLGKDIRFIKTGPLVVLQSSRLIYNTPLFYSAMAAPVLLFILLLGWRRRKLEREGNVSLMKSRGANKVARKRLSAAKKFLDQQKRENFLDEMFRALWGFVSDKLQIPVSKLSKENVANVMTARKVSEATVQQFIQTLDSIELARFAPGAAASIEEIYKSGISVISKLEEEIR